MKVRKKPVVVDAFLWLGTNVQALWEWLNEFDLHIAPPNQETPCQHCVNFDYTAARPILRIPTKEGVMEASVGDWIIRGVAGEFYPCKPDIFEKTYDVVEGADCTGCGMNVNCKPSCSVQQYPIA